MTAQREDLTIEQGATFKQRFIWQDVSGTPVNLSSASAKMQIRQSPYSDVVLEELSTANDRIVMDADGNIDLQLDPIDNLSLTFTAAVYDILITIDPIITRLVYGKVHLVKPVTQL
jgi:hypothetical protein